MPWITPTESDVHQTLNPDEIAAYRERRAAAQSDPLPGIITDVVAHIRGFVAGVLDVRSQTGIPHSLKNAALDIIVYRLAKRCHMSTEQQHKAAADDAGRLLEMVARGDHGLDVDDPPPGSGRWGSGTNIFS